MLGSYIFICIYARTAILLTNVLLIVNLLFTSKIMKPYDIEKICQCSCIDSDTRNQKLKYKD